ncbi:MAG TPA: indolepyruvate ferredoxin oxidoreductase family protein [Thermoleophilaceae bacterium]|jgi:indolepyruvate ferredoxin oxidoreductase|nr:indolepyruvate ferredoxin oxidoreductase family protein [Thermoleophilaceae bacterium]
MTSAALRRGAGRAPTGSRERTRGAGANGGRSGSIRRDISLEDKYVLEEGRILLTGVQGLVRLPLDQHRADRRLGLHTATMISGYQGSPLGGFDQELARNRKVAEEHHVRHVPGLNEELGATSAWGSQLAAGLPGARYDGVLALWYGKAPGLDRAADSLRHGNFVGVSRTGGALAVVGDDPSCKSSTVPSASEPMLASLQMPVFFPGSVQEVLDLGRHALACSRTSGLWVGFKIVTSVADAVSSAAVAPDRVAPVIPEVMYNGRPYEHVPNAHLLAPESLEMERTLLGPRTELALAYARENGINRIEGAGDAWLGVVAPGKSYFDLMHALRSLGLEGSALERAGVRILKLGMVSPLEPRIARDFAAGLDEILIAEEKGPFVETLLKDALYGLPDAPRVLGKRDEAGAPLLPMALDLDADLIARAVAARLAARGITIDSVEARLRKLAEIDNRPAELPMAQRTPFFCSGCPHNSSLKAPGGTLVGGGIGCHTMVLLNPEGKGEITGITQMGGEGAQWIGQAPFTDDSHLVQNLGDGTFHHSGSLAVRAAVAAGVNITYKLLYNEHVAMTGGQAIEGQLSVPDLTRWLELEGVRRIIVTTEDTSRYRGVELAGIAEVRDRGELLAAQQELAGVEGVTVLIHDQECAAELRRNRKRGKAEEPAERVWINERVCEGCGDCGQKSSCLSVIPVETEFGRKTQIHQASCNKDLSCLEGDCPSFLTVVPGERRKHRTPELTAELPEPAQLVSATDFSVRMMGIGGTGVVTVNQVLGMAALIDGLHVSGLDQTGLSQKGGPVISDLRITRDPLPAASKTPAGEVDLYLGFDLLGAASDKNLVSADPERTTAVVSTSAVPTGRMVIDTEERFPELSGQLDRIDAVTRREHNLYLDAQRLSERLFGDHMMTNTLALGAAFQRGLLPVSAPALEQAIRLNGAAVEKNLAAFAWGRAVVAAPDAVEAATREPEAVVPVRELTAAERELVTLAVDGDDGELRALVEKRVPELVAYQDESYARGYAEIVRRVQVAEQERAPGHTELSEAVARQLFKLMAYKDEYEVARLHLDAVERAKLDAEFGADAKVYFMLHPPLLRSLGLERKLKLGAWFVPAFRALYRMRRLRGSRLDPFGKVKVRRVERELVGEYERLIAEALELVTADTHATAVDLLELPDVIRGYEDIKLRNVMLYRKRAETILKRLRAGKPAPQLIVS